MRLIGTTVLLLKAEDREMFKETMEKIGEPVAPSDIVEDVKHGLEVAAHRLPGGSSSRLYIGRLRRRYCTEPGAVC